MGRIVVSQDGGRAGFIEYPRAPDRGVSEGPNVLGEVRDDWLSVIGFSVAWLVACLHSAKVLTDHVCSPPDTTLHVNRRGRTCLGQISSSWECALDPKAKR